MAVHKCLAGCGKTITWQFAICSECEKIYGKSMFEWEPWLRYLWQDTLKERRREIQISKNEVHVDIDNIPDDDDYVYRDRGKKHPPAE